MTLKQLYQSIEDLKKSYPLNDDTEVFVSQTGLVLRFTGVATGGMPAEVYVPIECPRKSRNRIVT